MNTRFVRLVLAGTVLALSGCLRPAPPPRPSEPPRTTLWVDLLDAATGAPIRQVCAVVIDERPEPIRRQTDGEGHLDQPLVPGPRQIVFV